jgi:HlyD family secretion protein
MKWLRSKAFIITLAVLVCAGGTYFYLSKGKKTTSKSTTETVVTAKKGEVKSVVSGTAQFEAKGSQMISAPTDGTIKTMNLTKSMTVKAGDILVELSDPSVENDLKKQKTTYDQLLKDYEDLKQQQNNMKLHAPLSGKLTYATNLDVGATVSKTTKVATISDLSKLSVKLPFYLEEAQQLHKGDTVDLTITGFMLTKSGTITNIGKDAIADGKGGKLVDIDISIVNDNTLDAALTAKGTVTIGGHSVESQASAALQYLNVVNVQANVIGNIESMPPKTGDIVHAGDLIANFVNDSLSDDLVSKQTAIDQQKLTVEEAQGKVDELVIKAPFDGVFSTDFVNKTSNVLSSYPVGSKIEKLTQLGGVANPNSMQLPVSVDELDLPNMKTGMKADVKVDSLADKKFEGVISSVSTVGTTTNGVTNYAVVLAVENPDQALKYGMTATAEILIQDKKDVIYLPPEALQKQNGKRYVTLKKADGTNEVKHEITIGITSATAVEITSGLSEGDKVVEPVVKKQSTMTQAEIDKMRQQFNPNGGGQGGVNGGGGTGGTRNN